MNYDKITIRHKDDHTILEYRDHGKIVYTHTVSKVNFEGGDTLTLDFSASQMLEGLQLEIDAAKERVFKEVNHDRP